MYKHFKNEADKQAFNDALKKTTVFLGQVASLLKSKRFATWYASNESRFSWATERTFAKLRKDLMFQVNQALPRDIPADASDIQRLQTLADLCDLTVEAAEKDLATTNTKKEKQFVFRKETSTAEAVFAFLSHGDTRGLIRELPNGFYIWNAVSSLITYARARETLAISTGNTVFERVLSGLNEDYVVNGYPHDLLSFDAHDVRTGVPVKALLMRNEYCSTQMVKQDEDLLPFEGGQVIHFKKAA